jgi:hypothetical protein
MSEATDLFDVTGTPDDPSRTWPDVVPFPLFDGEDAYWDPFDSFEGAWRITEDEADEAEDGVEVTALFEGRVVEIGPNEAVIEWDGWIERRTWDEFGNVSCGVAPVSPDAEPLLA